MTPIQTLTAAQVELLAVLAFEHVAVSQATMLRMLPPSWQRPQLQQVLQELIEEGWVEQVGSSWCVPALLQERVARYAWRNLPLILQAPAPECLSGPLTVRELRRALYAGNAELFALHWQGHQADFWSPFDPEWLDWLEPSIASRVIEQRVLRGESLHGEELTYLESRPQLLSDQVRREVAWAALLGGRLQVGEALGDATMLAFAQMQRGNAAAAVRLYASALPDEHPAGWLELLALMEARPWAEVEKWLKRNRVAVLSSLGQLGRGEKPSSLVWKAGQGLEGLLVGLLYAWQGFHHSGWEKECARLQAAGQHWLAAEYSSLLGSDRSHARLGTRTLLAVLRPLAPWELALEVLEKLRQPQRVVWKVTVYADGQSLTMEPVEQKLGPKGWSQGRPVALKKLALCDSLSASDRAICRHIGQDHFLDVAEGAGHLVGHPLVFHRETGELLDVREIRPRLEIRERGEDWWISLTVPANYRLEKGRLEILRRNAHEAALQEVVGEGLLVPPAGQARLTELLRELAILLDDGDVGFARPGA